MSDLQGVKFHLKIMTNERKTKVLFAEADSDFVDVLLTFLTLPLGTIVRVLDKHYAPVFGSLTTLYKGLADLDDAHFRTVGDKQMLLHPRSSFKDECRRLKLDIADTPPPEFFVCQTCNRGIPVEVVGCYIFCCKSCRHTMHKEVGEKRSKIGVFTADKMSFVISDDLQILPNGTAFVQLFDVLGVSDTESPKLMNATFGFSEIMDLLKASLVSCTPLTELVLNNKRQRYSATVKSEPGILLHQIEKEATSFMPQKIILKVMVQKSTNKILFAESDKDFVNFLSSFLVIPLGGVEWRLGNNTSIKSIDNLYRSMVDFIDTKYTRIPGTKNRFFSNVKFPQHPGIYVTGPTTTYMVTDDLTVTPFRIASTFALLHQMKTPISDAKELELNIGSEEGLRILKASLTSTSALTNGLMNHLK